VALLLAAALLLTPQPSLCADGLYQFEGRCLTADEYYAWPPAPVLPPSAPAPAPKPVYAPGVEQWRPMVAYYWPAAHVDRMLRITKCESNGNPRAVNPRSGAAGLFQIMPFWKRVWAGDYLDPWVNAATAYQIWLVQGYGAWVCK